MFPNFQVFISLRGLIVSLERDVYDELLIVSVDDIRVNTFVLTVFFICFWFYLAKNKLWLYTILQRKQFPWNDRSALVLVKLEEFGKNFVK